MASFGELVLVLGDLHVPHRAAEIPEKFNKILLPGRIKQVLCTGNLCTREQMDFLKSLAPNVHVTGGDFDEDSKLPETKVITIGSFKIGLSHGHQVVPWGDIEALAALRRELDVDVLVTGHTHQNNVLQYEEKLYVNPGSITGAYSTTTPDVVPSFVLMSILDDKVVTYVYELRGTEMKVTKSEYTKPGGAAAASK